jgi:hypothetical protein
MSRITDLTVTVLVSDRRHCTEPGCEKCRARSRWMRRRAWRSRNSVGRVLRDRKR